MATKNIFKIMMMLLGVIALGITSVSCEDDDDNILVTGISLDKTELSIVQGKTAQLTATILPQNATEKTVVFSSSDEGIATVDKQGKITAVAFGTADIMVKTKDRGKVATCTVTVLASKESIIGKWYYEKDVINGVEDTSGEFECSTKKDFSEFFPDSKIIIRNYNDKCEEAEVYSDGTWQLSGNTLTTINFTDEDIIETWTIVSLDANTLVLHYDKLIEDGKEKLIDFDEDGKKDDVTIYLKKLQ